MIIVHLSLCSFKCMLAFRIFYMLFYLSRLRRYKWKSIEVGVLRRGWVIFSRYLTVKGASCWCQKTGVIAVSCGIKISAVHHLVLSQYTHVTDRQTELRQQYRAMKDYAVLL